MDVRVPEIMSLDRAGNAFWTQIGILKVCRYINIFRNPICDSGHQLSCTRTKFEADLYLK